MGRALALSLFGSLSLLLQTQELIRPPPRVAIGGLSAIECVSAVVYAAAPDAPHRLNTTYAFPDRARWWLGIGAEDSLERQMRLRFGDALYAIDKQGGTSRELLAEERLEALVQLEMRRALLMWPLGFEWKRSGDTSSTVIPRVGRLTARFADVNSKHPSTLEFTAEDGRPGDAFRAISWRDDKDKAWPVKLELWQAQKLIWTETIGAIETKTRFIDSYFLPPDKRDGSFSRPLEVGSVRSTDLNECRVQRVALKAGATLDEAFAEWKRVVDTRTKELAPRGFALDDKVTLEIGRDARARALLLRLAPTKTALPDDLARIFEVVGDRPALTTFVIGLRSVSVAPLDALAAALPPDAAAGQPYLRFDPNRPSEHVLIVLPLLPGGK